MSNFNFNKVFLGGRLTADPELKQTQNGTAVASFSIAVNRKYNKDAQQTETDFFNITAWRQAAEFVSRYFKKGSSICIVGNLQNRSWTDQNNQKHFRTDIIAEEVMFVDSKADSASEPTSAAPSTVTPNFTAVSTDEDVPF